MMLFTLVASLMVISSSSLSIDLYGESIDLLIDKYDWFNDDYWYTSHTILNEDGSPMHQKCMTNNNCYCALKNSEYYTIRSTHNQAVPAFICFGNEKDEFRRYNAAFGDFMDYYLYDDDNYDYTPYDLRWTGRGSPNGDDIPFQTTEVKDYGVGHTGDCIVALSSHHIIPDGDLIAFWNKLIVADYASFKMIARKLDELISKYITRNDITGAAIADYQAAQVTLKAIVAGGAAGITHDATSVNVPAQLRQIRALFEWMPGNLFSGPKRGARSDDPADTGVAFETNCKHIVGVERGTALKLVYDAIQELKSNTALTAGMTLKRMTGILIKYGLGEGYTAFNGAQWQIFQDAADSKWKFKIDTTVRPIPKRRRRLYDLYNYVYEEEGDSSSLYIYGDVNMIFNLDDWHDNEKWITSQLYDTVVGRRYTIQQKCVNAMDCYCHEFNQHYRYHNAYITANLCKFTVADPYPVAVAAAYATPNNLAFGGDKTRKYPKIFGKPFTRFTTSGRYCPILMGRHHIIPANLLLSFWNKIAENNKWSRISALLTFFKTSSKYFRTDAQVRQWIDEILGGVHTHATGQPKPKGSNGGRHGRLKQKFVWMPGNILIGPDKDIRADDAGSAFETGAKKIIADDAKYDKLWDTYKAMDYYVKDDARNMPITLGEIATNLRDICAKGTAYPFDPDQWEVVTVAVGQSVWKIKAA